MTVEFGKPGTADDFKLGKLKDVHLVQPTGTELISFLTEANEFKDTWDFTIFSLDRDRTERTEYSMILNRQHLTDLKTLCEYMLSFEWKE